MENEVKEIYLVEDETQESESGILGKIMVGVIVAGIAAGGAYLVRKLIKKRKDKKEDPELCATEEDDEYENEAQ